MKKSQPKPRSIGRSNSIRSLPSPACDCHLLPCLPYQLHATDQLACELGVAETKMIHFAAVHFAVSGKYAEGSGLANQRAKDMGAVV